MAAVLALALWASGRAAQAEAVPAANHRRVQLPFKNESDRLMADILLDEIQLEKFNLHYRLEATRQGRWKGLRYAGFQTTNYALTDAGLITTVAERFPHISSPKTLHVGALRHSNVMSGVAQTVGAGGSALEFAINEYHWWRAYRLGFSALTARVHVQKLVADIDAKLALFDTLVVAERRRTPAGTTEVHALEHEILSDMRDLSVAEFEGFHMNARRLLWRQQSFYLLDIAKNTTGALGNLFGYQALRRGNRLLNRPAGVLTLLSGAQIIANPILSRLAGLAVVACDRWELGRAKLRKVETTCAKLEDDCARLQQYCADNRIEEHPNLAGSVKRIRLYEASSARWTAELRRSTEEVRAGNRQAVQNIMAATATGATKLALGIEFTAAGYNFAGSGRRTNVLLGSGALVYMVGDSLALLDQIRITAKGELDHYRLRRQGKLPGQLIQARLEKLDEMEKALVSIKSDPLAK